MKRIVVPTDFSAAAESTVEVAANIAMKENCQIALLHAVELPSQHSFNVAGEVPAVDDPEQKIFSIKLMAGDRHKLALVTA